MDGTVTDLVDRAPHCPDGSPAVIRADDAERRVRHSQAARVNEFRPFNILGL